MLMKPALCLTITTPRGSIQIPAQVLFSALLVFCGSLAFAAVSFFRLDSLQADYLALDDAYRDAQAHQLALAEELDAVQHAYLQQLQRPAVELAALINHPRNGVSQAPLELTSPIPAPDLNGVDAHYLELAAKLNIPVPTVDDHAWKSRVISDAYERLALLYDIPNGAPLMEYRDSDGFGQRMHPIKQKMIHHKGVDMKADRGTPIYAPANGVVSRASRAGTFGKLLVLEHGYGFKTKYAHLADYAVKAGTAVKKGDIIAYVGSTGASTGAHLHYEVHYLNRAVDPSPFLDWGLHNYEQLFAKVGNVPWDSLKNLQPVKPVRLARR